MSKQDSTRQFMAAKRIDMTTLKQLLLLRASGQGIKRISSSLGISKNTVKKYLRELEDQGLDLQKVSSYPEEKLLKVFTKNGDSISEKTFELHNFFPYVDQELKKVGVTRWSLWEEYKRKVPSGYNYSQFCYHYQQWRNGRQAYMHIEHKAGDKMFVDYTGKKLSITCLQTGKERELEVFVAILGASQYTYVEASESQQKSHFIESVENALHYFGGVPSAIVPDNLKSAVTKSSSYEAELNRSFSDFASHYGTVILPTRSYKPKDKSLVENAVRIIYTRIFATLRNQTFYSVTEVNIAIKSALEKHNQMLFQGKDYSRKSCFERVEQKELQPLPSSKYELKEFSQVTALQNSHVYLKADKHYYSIPYRFIGKRVQLVYDSNTVMIYFNHQRIACHQRNYRHYQYTTLKDHLPSEHQFVSNWSPDFFLDWASKIGSLTHSYIKEVLETKAHPEQAYKSCVGILGLAKKAGNQRLENACQRANYYQSYGYQIIKRIIEKGLDKEPIPQENTTTVPIHENIRGQQYYQ